MQSRVAVRRLAPPQWPERPAVVMPMTRLQKQLAREERSCVPWRAHCEPEPRDRAVFGLPCFPALYAPRLLHAQRARQVQTRGHWRSRCPKNLGSPAGQLFPQQPLRRVAPPLSLRWQEAEEYRRRRWPGWTPRPPPLLPPPHRPHSQGCRDGVCHTLDTLRS